MRPVNGPVEVRAHWLRHMREEADMDLQISMRKSGDISILDLRGRLVIGVGNDLLATELGKLAGNSPCNVLVNLTQVTQMDSSGISTLVKSFVTLKREGHGSLRILNPTGSVHEVLEVTGLIHCLPTYTDEVRALASFHGSVAHA
jgi:anti-sigma B factor antagonist